MESQQYQDNDDGTSAEFSATPVSTSLGHTPTSLVVRKDQETIRVILASVDTDMTGHRSPCARYQRDEAYSIDLPPNGHQLFATSAPRVPRESRGHRNVQLKWPTLSISMTTTLLWMLLFTSTCCLAAPTVNSTEAPARPPMDSLKYLESFGYLPNMGDGADALRTPEELARSIRELQRMANIPMTGVFDTETRKLLVKPRCGVRDVGLAPRQKRYVIGPSKWDKKEITFRIINYSADLPQSEQRQAIVDAFHVWMRVTQLTFHEVMQGPADMIMKFARYDHGDGYVFDGLGLVLAHAFFPGEERGGDVHFDEDENWTVFSDEGTNLFSVAAHEIGHALGLRHSNVQGALMYPWYQGYMEDFELHPDDVAGIQFLYGRKSPDTRPPRTLPPVTARPTRGPTRPGVTRPGVTRPGVTRPGVTNPPPTYPAPTYPSGRPDPCVDGFDAISIIRTEIYAFKGRWFWRIGADGLFPGFPVEIERFWYGLPDYVNKIDAAYERESDGKILFFSGNRFWLLGSNHLEPGFPADGKPLIDMGFPDDVEKVDAAFIWGHNQMTYLISGHRYWRYNELRGDMEYDYPRDMRMWRGVPVPIDSAFQHWDGRTYFFKGHEFYEFHDALMKVKDTNPRHIGALWLECPLVPKTKDETQEDVPLVETNTFTIPNSAATRTSSFISVVLNSLSVALAFTPLNTSRIVPED